MIKMSRNFDQASETLCERKLLMLKEFLQFTRFGETP